MDETPLRAALQKLLARGEAASGARMMKAHAAKNAPPGVTPDICPECKAPLVEGKCEKCGYSMESEDGDLAGLLEQGAAED